MTSSSAGRRLALVSSRKLSVSNWYKRYATRPLTSSTPQSLSRQQQPIASWPRCSLLSHLYRSPSLRSPTVSKWARSPLSPTPGSACSNAPRAGAARLSSVPSCSTLTGVGSTTSVAAPTAIPATPGTPRSALTPQHARRTALSMVLTTQVSISNLYGPVNTTLTLGFRYLRYHDERQPALAEIRD